MTIRLPFAMLMLSLSMGLAGCTDVKIINVIPTAAPANTPSATTPPRPSATELQRSPTPTPPPVEPTSTPTGPTPTMGEETETPTPSPTSTTVVGPPIGEFTCTLDPPNSMIIIHLIGDNMISIFEIGGTFVAECGGVDPETGVAVCIPQNLQLDPVTVLGVGVICATYVPNCPAGQVACNGGPPLDTDLLQNHNIGACDGNAACGAQCQTFCEGLEATSSVFDSGCAGFCEAGPNDGNPCTQDIDCPQGACNGGDPVDPPNICGCQCLSISGSASRPGGLLTSFGVQLNVEATAPCANDDITISLPPVCIPLATEKSTGLITNANNRPGVEIGPITVTGEPVSCDQLMTGSASGMTVVSNVSFFDSALRDLEAEVSFRCQ